MIISRSIRVAAWLSFYINIDNRSVSMVWLLISMINFFWRFNDVLIAIPSNITLLFLLRQIRIFKVTTCFSTETTEWAAVPGQFIYGVGKVPGNEWKAFWFFFFFFHLSNPQIWTGVGVPIRIKWPRRASPDRFLSALVTFFPQFSSAGHPLHTHTASLPNSTSWVPQTGAAVNSYVLGEDLSSSLWWAENWWSKRKRERHNTNRIIRIGFFCHSFTSECTSVRTSVLNEDIKTRQVRFMRFVSKIAWLYYYILFLPLLPWDILSLCFYGSCYKKLYQEQAMKGEKEPGIRNTPFVSNNKAVFHLSTRSSAKAQGLAQCPACRNSMFKSFVGSWSSPLPGWKKETSRDDVQGFLLPLEIP